MMKMPLITLTTSVCFYLLTLFFYGDGMMDAWVGTQEL